VRSAALLALAAVGVAPGAPGCDPRAAAATALAALGHPSVQLVDAPEGARLAASGGLLLQIRGEERLARAVPGARLVREAESLADAPAGRSFVVISDEPELGLRLGARLAREGAAQVALVEGGLPAWGPVATDPGTREE